MPSQAKEEFYKIFIRELRNIYSAEKELVEIMPDFIDSVFSKELKEALKSHLKETKNQKNRLEKLFSNMNIKPEGGSHEGITGLLRECQKWNKGDQQSIVDDAALIGSLQKIEHYEIASYGTLRAFAKHLDLKQEEKILQEILEEEGSANKKLTKIAEGGFFTSGLNKAASMR